MNRETDLWTIAVIVGLAAVTVLTRCFFFILDRPWSLPTWALQALNYAPIAALAGVVLPEVVMANGQLKSRETVFDGLEAAPDAFMGLFTGANMGKMLVRL